MSFTNDFSFLYFVRLFPTVNAEFSVFSVSLEYSRLQKFMSTTELATWSVQITKVMVTKWNMRLQSYHVNQHKNNINKSPCLENLITMHILALLLYVYSAAQKCGNFSHKLYMFEVVKFQFWFVLFKLSEFDSTSFSVCRCKIGLGCIFVPPGLN